MRLVTVHPASYRPVSHSQSRIKNSFCRRRLFFETPCLLYCTVALVGKQDQSKTLRHCKCQQQQHQQLPPTDGGNIRTQNAKACSWQRSDIGGKTVAAGPDRRDQCGFARIGLDLAAQAADLVVDGVVKHLCRPPRSHVRQLIAAEHKAGAFQKDRQKAEFGSGQGDVDAVCVGQGAAVGIQNLAVKRQPVPCKSAASHLGPFGTAQDRLDPGQELAWIERLGQIVIRPHFKPDDAVGFIAKGSQHQDRHAAFCAQATTDRKPSSPGIITASTI